MIIPFSLLAEGTAMTATALLSFSDASVLDIFLGAFGAIAMLATTVIWALKLRFPFHRLRCIEQQADNTNSLLDSLSPFRWCAENKGRLQCVRAEPQETLLIRLLNPRWEWTLALEEEGKEKGRNISTTGSGGAETSNVATALLPNESLDLPPLSGAFPALQESETSLRPRGRRGGRSPQRPCQSQLHQQALNCLWCKEPISHRL